MRKTCFLLLLLMLFLPASLVQADVEEDFAYSVNEGRATITAYTGSADTLTVPDTLGGYPVTAIRYCAFRNCTALSAVTLPDGITSIGSNAFQGCISLSQIALPGNLTTIGTHAFYGCSNLLQITFPESLERLHPYAFYGCSAVRLCSSESRAARALTAFGYSIISPDFPHLSLMVYDSAISVTDCDESAVSVSFPNGVTLIDGYAFFNCASLTEIAIPDGVTEIAYSAFEGCSALKQITIPGSVVKIADDAFSGCRDITIIAPVGSAAQAFAQANAEHGFTWRAL
ncbi:MAG: leucine-rich repeat domain-containing protein [Clostridia bacterium]|nr:leucine-rich repeat domain-containing protein [Clostridia bacterium]